MIKKFLATTAIAAVTAMPAVAGTLADPVVEPPVMPVYEPETDWSGFYIGANGAAGIVNPGAVMYYGGGAHAGYLNDMGDFVIGAELNYNYVVNSNDHLFGLDAILGYDAGSIMPHVTVGGAYVVNPAVFGVTAGAGLSVMASDSVMLTARYRFGWDPVGGNTMHHGTAMVSFKF